MSLPPHVEMLRSELQRRKEKNRLFSLRAFAKLMGQHPSAMSRILNSKQELSVSASARIMKKLGLTPVQQETFIVSVANQRFRLALAALTEKSEVRDLKSKLRAEEESFRALFHHVVHAVQLFEVVRDKSGKTIDLRLIRANSIWEEMMGFKAEDLVGRKVSEWLPGVEAYWLATFDDAGTAGSAVRIEQRYGPLDRWFDVTVEPTTKDRFFVQTIEVTERRKHEETSKKFDHRLRAVTSLVPQMLWQSECDGSTAWYNQRWLDYTGQSLEKSIGWGWVVTIHPDDRKESSRRYLEAVANATTFEEEQRILSASGEYRWFSVRTAPSLGEDGRVSGMFSAATDIHHLKLAAGAEG